MKKLTALTLIIFFNCAIIFAQISPSPEIINSPTSKTNTPFNPNDLIGLTGHTAPPFVLPAMNGTEFSLEKLRGKIVVVNLWGTFCPPCIVEMPHLNSLAEKYKNKDVVFLAPSPEDKAALENFLKKTRFDYQVLPNGMKIIEQYAPRKKSADPEKPGEFMMLLPTHLVIDQNGKVVYHEWGFRKDMTEKLSAEIEKLLEKSAEL